MSLLPHTDRSEGTLLPKGDEIAYLGQVLSDPFVCTAIIAKIPGYNFSKYLKKI